MTKYIKIENREKVEEKNTVLEQFVYEYVQNHLYVSKIMLSGLFIVKCNPKHNRADTKKFQKKIKHRISLILNTYKELGICETYGKNTVKINRKNLKEFSLSDIMGYVIKNPEN